MDHFGAAIECGEGAKSSPPPPFKIEHTYHISHNEMMKLGAVLPYVKKIKKIYESRNTSSADIGKYR